MISRRWQSTSTRLRGAAGTVGDALRSVGYSEDGVVDLLGDDAYSGGAEDVPVNERMLPNTKLATVVRAFFLLLPVPTEDAVEALGRDAVDSLEDAGLVECWGRGRTPSQDSAGRRAVRRRGRLLARRRRSARLRRRIHTDGAAARLPDPASRVSSAPSTSAPAAASTRFARTPYAQSVIATDVNPRALEFTRLNAALNGLTNIETRIGSLFEPVVGETFDLITCNAPYVVSPERRWTYRDAGGTADEVSERVVAESAAHLAEGGFATMNVSWVAEDEDEPDERVVAWAERTGCDSWILVAEESDPLGHAAGWNSHLQSDPEAYGAALDEWARYLEELGVRWVSDGTVILKRRGGGEPTVRVDSVDEDDVEESGEQIERAFENRARLEELGRNDLLELSLSVGDAPPASARARAHGRRSGPDRRGRGPGQRHELRRRHDARCARDPRAPRR